MGGPGLEWRFLEDFPWSQPHLSLESLLCPCPSKPMLGALAFFFFFCSPYCILFLLASKASGLTKLRPVLGGSPWNPLISMRPVLINMYFKPQLKRGNWCEYFPDFSSFPTPHPHPTSLPAAHSPPSVYVSRQPLCHLRDTSPLILSVPPWST